METRFHGTIGLHTSLARRNGHETSKAADREYLRARSLPIEGLSIRVSAEKAAQPARLAAFHVELYSRAAREDRHREGLVRAVKKCLIHNTLLHPPEFEIVVNESATAVAS